MVPGVVQVAVLVARTDTHAVLVDGLLVYPTGFDFDLAVRRRPGHPHRHRHRGHLWGDDLRLEVRFADGRSADNNPRRWPRPSGDQLPDPPLLYQSTSGADGGHVWLWGLPPPGPLTFACHWPSAAAPATPASTMTAGTGGAMTCIWRSASPTAAAPTTTPAAGPTPPATGCPTRRCCTRAPAAPTAAMCGCGASRRPDR